MMICTLEEIPDSDYSSVRVKEYVYKVVCKIHFSVYVRLHSMYIVSSIPNNSVTQEFTVPKILYYF